MPELPEVETFRRYFDATALGRRIEAVHVTAPEMLMGTSVRTLRSHLEHRRFVRTRRHGKFLFAGSDRGDWLVLHFGMSGFLERYTHPEAEPPHTRLRIDFSGGSHLALDDQRKFGRIALTRDVDAFVEQRRLGPDPLENGLDPAAFTRLVGRRRGAVKPMLLNQRVIAGVGNIYADEILFQARLHPETPVQQLGDASQRNLYLVMVRVLGCAVRARADVDRLPRGYLLRHRYAGGRCPRCGRTLARVTIGARTTYYCPHDQPRGGSRR